MNRTLPDLDLHLPTLDGPGFPPPVLTAEQYGKWMESLWESMRQDGSLARFVASRPCPVEEMFVLK